MSFFESFKRFLGGRGRDRRPSGHDASASGGAPGDASIAMIPCEEAAARLFEFLDGELESMSEAEVRRHLEICKNCYSRAQFEKHFLEALRRSRNGGRASTSLKERLLQALAEDEGQD